MWSPSLKDCIIVVQHEESSNGDRGCIRAGHLRLLKGATPQLMLQDVQQSFTLVCLCCTQTQMHSFMPFLPFCMRSLICFFPISHALFIFSLMLHSLSKELRIDRSSVRKCSVHQHLWGLQDLDEEDLDGSFEQYCQDIQDTAAWGGQTELNALANVLQHHIKVYAAGLPVVDMGQQFTGDHPVLVKLLHMFQCCDVCQGSAMCPAE